MNQVRHIGDRLESDLGAVECATTSRRSGREQFVAALLPFLVGLRLIRGAAWLIKDTLYSRAQCAHRFPRRAKPVRNALPADVEAVIGLRHDVCVLIYVIENLIENSDQNV